MTDSDPIPSVTEDTNKTEQQETPVINSKTYFIQ